MSKNESSLAGSSYEARLAELLNQRFTLQELRDLCFDLNVDFENIPGNIKQEKAQELTKYFARRKILGQFVAAIKGARPDIVLGPPPTEVSPAQGQATSVYVAYLSAEPVEESPGTFERLTSVSDLLREAQPTTGRQETESAHREGSAAEQPPPGVSLHSQTDSDLLLISYDDCGPLLRSVLAIAREAKADGGFTLTAGIHSATIYTNPEETERAVPNEVIDLTRRVTSLGKDGHILATANVAETLRRDASLRRFIHESAKCEVKYHVRVEIYNIYDEADATFGNPTRPNPVSPAEVLKGVSLPEELRCARPERVVLSFSPDVNYAKVVFGFRNSDLQVSCDGLGDEDCTFDYYPADGNHTKVFELWAVKSTEETLEPVSIRCFDEAGELMAPPVRGRVLLRRRTPDPSGASDVIKIPLWLWDRFVCLRPSRKILAVLALLLAVAGYGALKYDWNRFELDKERAFIKLRIWPKRYSGPWPETFADTSDHRPDGNKWSVAPPSWRLVNPEDDSSTDKSLRVRGEQVGLNSMQDASLYDFKALLRFRILDHQRVVSWILRARNTGDYYLFVLTLPPRDGVKAKIQGFLYEDGREAGRLVSDLEEIDYKNPFTEDLRLFINIEAVGNSFKHTFSTNIPPSILLKETGARSEEEIDPEKEGVVFDKYLIGSHLTVVFSDSQKRYRWGSIGFRGLLPADEMEIEEVKISEAS